MKARWTCAPNSPSLADLMSRRLPIYLVLDISGSMQGEPIEAVKNGLQLLTSHLRQDPQALETAYLSMITFSDSAQQVVPLTDLSSFQPASISAGGQTGLGSALKLVAECIQRDVKRTSATEKGDWKPIVFLMTDGQPTDSWQNGLAALRNQKVGSFIACAAGQAADTGVLQQITESVVRLDTADSATIGAFFKWVSASISVSSTRVDLQKKDTASIGDLPPPPPEIQVV